MSLSFKSEFMETGKYFKSIKITISNNAKEKINEETTISFELLDRGTSLTCSGMNLQNSDNPLVIIGKLEFWKINEINTQGTVEIKIDIDCKPESNITLPTNFKVNNINIDIPDPEPVPIPPEPNVSALIQADDLTEKKYIMNEFTPSSETTKFSYTSARVLKDVYNKYEPDNLKIDGYYTSWSQYDGRLENLLEDSNCGRGVDIAKHLHNNVNTAVLGFFALTGDKGEKKETIETAAKELKLQDSQVNPVDNWGMLLSYRNCGFDGWKTNDPLEMYDQSTAQGMLGAFSKMKQANPTQKLAFSIGGWTMSEAFHKMVESETTRKIFSKSVSDFLVKFPMFEEIDIDWEYPGAQGVGNPYGSNDGKNYALLIKELKESLNDIGRSDVSIAVAVSADPETLAKSNISDLIAAGLTKIHLMTYDFFGTPWSKELNHHTNLYHKDDSTWSVDKAVTYLEKLDIPMEYVYLGYASYSRNAKNAEITSVSPLEGEYNPQGSSTIGTFESGATEYYDILNNYYDPETGQGKNGFVLYTDKVSDADFLYNPVSKVFMSIDTPRTVHAKAQYAKEHKLGGLFTWTMDMDNGLLLNAAHEGLGHKVIEQKLDMNQLYSHGLYDMSEQYDTNLLGNEVSSS